MKIDLDFETDFKTQLLMMTAACIGCSAIIFVVSCIAGDPLYILPC